MALSDEVAAGIQGVLDPEWKTIDGQVVPESKNVTLKDGAVKLDATYLYADMVDSTSLAQTNEPLIVAKVIRCYLNTATRIIRERDGEIRSFDGDRVMGIFIGDYKNSNAAKAALNISWAVSEIVNPKLKDKWENLNWTMKHGVGIDTGEAILVRGGVQGDNDIISVGSAPNVAAKLSEIRNGKSVYISEAVYKKLNDGSKFSGNKENNKDMWTLIGSQTYGGKKINYYGSDEILKP